MSSDPALGRFKRKGMGGAMPTQQKPVLGMLSVLYHRSWALLVACSAVCSDVPVVFSLPAGPVADEDKE